MRNHQKQAWILVLALWGAAPARLPYFSYIAPPPKDSQDIHPAVTPNTRNHLGRMQEIFNSAS